MGIKRVLLDALTHNAKCPYRWYSASRISYATCYKVGYLHYKPVNYTHNVEQNKRQRTHLHSVLSVYRVLPKSRISRRLDILAAAG